MKSKYVNYLSEFVGTIFLTWMIALLGVTFNGTKFEYLISLGDHEKWVSKLVIGFWVALDVALCLAIFSRWSCDLNPAVTLYRILSKQNTIQYGLTKMAVQFVAAFGAAGVIIATQDLVHGFTNNPADTVDSTTNNFKSVWSAFTINDRPFAGEGKLVSDSNYAAKHIISFIGEFCGVLILLWPIFTKSIKSPVVKDILVVLIVGFGVAALLELGTVGWNPARTLATNFIYDVAHHSTHAMTLYWAYLFGPFAAATALWAGQKWFHNARIEHLWEKWLSFGKIREPKHQ